MGRDSFASSEGSLQRRGREGEWVDLHRNKTCSASPWNKHIKQENMLASLSGGLYLWDLNEMKVCRTNIQRFAGSLIWC